MISKPDLECNTRGCRLQQQSWQCFSLSVTIQSNLPASPSAHFTCHSCSPVTIYTHLHWNSISRTLRRWFQVKLQVLSLNKYFSFGFLWWNTFIRAKCNNCYSAHSVNSRHLWSCPEISSGLKLQLLTNAFNIKVYHMYGFAYHLKSLRTSRLIPAPSNTRERATQYHPKQQKCMPTLLMIKGWCGHPERNKLTI